MRTSADSITPKITSMESKRGSFRDSGKWRAGWYSASSLGEPTLLPKKIVLFLPISENAARSTLQRVLADESSHAWIVPVLVFIVQTCRLTKVCPLNKEFRFRWGRSIVLGRTIRGCEERLLQSNSAIVDCGSSRQQDRTARVTISQLTRMLHGILAGNFKGSV